MTTHPFIACTPATRPIRSFAATRSRTAKVSRLFKRLHGAHSGEQLVASLRDICPDFADMTIEWAIHGVMARPGLDLVTRELLLIAACTTLGFATVQLRAHIEAAVAVGARREQIVETILQMTFYAGGAATSNALRIAAEALATIEPHETGDATLAGDPSVYSAESQA